jgi:hypothetical protein
MTLRKLALPYEHGAWGFLLEPVAVGLLVAPSRAGVLVAVGAIAAFLARHPLRMAVRDWVTHKRVPRTRTCVMLALGYGLVAIAALSLVGVKPLIPLVVAVPLAFAQFVLDVRNRGRALPAELAGAIAAGWAASAIALAGSRPVAVAIALWALLAARAVTSVFYVRSSLRGESRVVMLALHGVAVGFGAFISMTAMAAMGVLFARALPGVTALRARDIGMRELGFGVLTVLLIALA